MTRKRDSNKTDIKKTYGLGLHDTNPVDAELMNRLEQVDNKADLLRTALLFYLDEAGRGSAITEQEVNQLRARVAFLEQNQATPGQNAGAQVAAPQSESKSTQPGGELSQEFLDAIRKAARPGIRLET
jgi:hypothetical protein